MAQTGSVNNGEAGFVVADMVVVLPENEDSSAACADGLTRGYQQRLDAFLSLPEVQRHPGENDEDYEGRIYDAALNDPDIRNFCQNPELGDPDPQFRVFKTVDAPMPGLNLDGLDSRVEGPAGPGSCPHNDFVGLDGGSGIDNQFFRIIGCGSPQSWDQGLSTGIHAGEWGILIQLTGVDDIRNDDEVIVGMYASADPIRLSPNRVPLEYGTYAMDQDSRFRAETRGRIKDGVLTTDPVDVRFLYTLNAMYLERPLLGARLQMTLSEEGILEGYLAGYIPVEAMYDLWYGFRNGLSPRGQPAPLWLRNNSAIGKALVHDYTCQGAYYALHEYADGHPDPETGKCTSISIQYRVKAIPAFVVDVESKSLNE